MKRSTFILKLVFLFVLSSGFTFLPHASLAFDVKRNFFEIKIYHLKSSSQSERVEKYLRDAFIPALHRAGIKKIGVFKPVVDSVDEQLIYVLIPYTGLDQFEKVPTLLEKDKQYNMDGKDYIDAVYTDPPYVRIESILLKAFEGMPSYNVPYNPHTPDS